MENSELTDEQTEELLTLARYNRSSVPSYFWDISVEHQELHEKYLCSAKSLYDKEAEWQSEEYYSIGDRSQKSAYIAIIFAVMYIEGAIYNFGCIYLGDDYVQRNLDRLSTISKITVILRMVTQKDLNTDGQAYEHLKRLIKYRNGLIHPKSKPTKFGKEAFLRYEKEKSDYHRAIDSAKKAIEYLDKETRKINNDEHHPGLFGYF
ncbi:MAG: hypothetical protein COB30_000060 [Ectothiorhodospiraceae bacterium]|nr:hypothetical protein [Ectothiorhodospiraceae bacterium]